MKKYIPHIIIVLLFAFVAYLLFNQSGYRDDLKEANENLKKVKESSQKTIDSLNLVNDTRLMQIEKEQERVNSLQYKDSINVNQLRFHRRTYRELVNASPETTADSILNLQQREEVLLSENSVLESSNNNLREQVSTLEGINVGLKEVIVNKDLIIAQKDSIIVAQDLTLQTYDDALKQERRNGNKKGVGGVLVGVLIGILIL